MINGGQSFIDQFQSGSGFDSLVGQSGLIRGVDQERLRAELAFIRQTCQADAFPGAVLPRPVSGNIVYYLLAQSPRDWRGLKPLALAFAGPTVTNFQGQTTRLDPNDPAEALLLQQSFHAVSRSVVPRDCLDFERKKLVALFAIKRLAELQLSRPPSPHDRPETTADLLLRFDHALSIRDLDSAEAILEALRCDGRLDAMNLRFLRVNLLARGNRWQELRSSSFFASLCLTRRPASIGCALVEALYHTELIGSEPDPAALMAVFKEKVLPNSGALFERLPDGASAVVLKAFALHIATRPEGSAELGRRLEEEAAKPGREAFASFWKSLSWGEGDAGRKVPSFSDLVSIPPPASVDRACTVLVAAFEEEDTDKARQAIGFMDKLSSSEREGLLQSGKYATIWRHLREMALGGWVEWLTTLEEHRFTQYRDLAHQAARQWTAREQLGSERDVKDFLAALSKTLGSDLGRKRLADCLPIMVDWVLTSESVPLREALPVCMELLEFFPLTERVSDEALNTFSLLFEGVLRHNLTKVEYGAALEAAALLNDIANGAKALDWRIDLAETVVDNHSPDTARRDALLWAVVCSIEKSRLPVTTWRRKALAQVLAVLGSESASGLERLPGDGVTTSTFTSLAGRLVAVYTLTESAGRRVLGILSELAPGVRVVVNHDLVGSSNLKQLAREADVFVVAARSAKHAATEFIMHNRPQGKPVVYPMGKGSSSIIHALEGWLKRG